MTKFRNLHLGLTALLVAALAGCDSVLIPGPGDEAEESPYACWFDVDGDSFVTPFGLDAQGFEIDLRQYDAATLEDCRTRHNGGEPLAWGRTDRMDPDDTDECVGPSPSGWGVADLCPDGAGDDDSDDGDDDQGDDDDDTADDDTTPTGDDDDSTPEEDPEGTPDNGEPWVEACYDPDGGSNPLYDPIVSSFYVYQHPTSGWFDGNDVTYVERSGNRYCFTVQCNRTTKFNGEVNGSNLFTGQMGFMAHLDEEGDDRLWGEVEANDSRIDDLDFWTEPWVDTNGVEGADGYIDAECN